MMDYSINIINKMHKIYYLWIVVPQQIKTTCLTSYEYVNNYLITNINSQLKIENML